MSGLAQGCVCMCVCVCSVTSVVSDPLESYKLQPARLLCPWDSPGKNPRVGFHFLLQGIFPTQGSNPGLPHCRQVPLPRDGTHAHCSGSAES